MVQEILTLRSKFTKNFIAENLSSKSYIKYLQKYKRIKYNINLTKDELPSNKGIYTICSTSSFSILCQWSSLIKTIFFKEF